MKYHFIIILAFVTSGIDSRSVRSSNYDEEALHWGPRTNLLRQNLVKDISDSQSIEVPNTIDDSTARESSNEVLTNLLTNNNSKKYPSSPLILSQTEKLEKLLSDFVVEKEDRTATQLLKHLKLTTDQLTGKNNSELKYSGNLKELSDVVESRKPTLGILKTVNSLKDIIDSADELDIYYQDGHEDNRHVISRHEDSSALFPLVRNEVLGLNHLDSITLEEIKNEENATEELDTMLSELQGQVNRMRKYLDSDCRKYHKSSATDSINQPNKIIMLQ